jgi:hypothetical protein
VTKLFLKSPCSSQPTGATSNKHGRSDGFQVRVVLGDGLFIGAAIVTSSVRCKNRGNWCSRESSDAPDGWLFFDFRVEVSAQHVK